jgi:ketosteroid isomerase-like protein
MSLMLTAAALIAPASNLRAGDRAQSRIRSALQTWMAEFNAGDSRKVCGLFAPDLIADYQGQPERDFPSLCKLLRGSLSDQQRKFHYSLDIKEILVSGGLAVVRLVWTLRVYPKNGSEAHSTVEPGIDIFRLEPDGNWKICRFMAYGVSP